MALNSFLSWLSVSEAVHDYSGELSVVQTELSLVPFLFLFCSTESETTDSIPSDEENAQVNKGRPTFSLVSLSLTAFHASAHFKW